MDKGILDGSFRAGRLLADVDVREFTSGVAARLLAEPVPGQQTPLIYEVRPADSSEQS